MIKVFTLLALWLYVLTLWLASIADLLASLKKPTPIDARPVVEPEAVEIETEEDEPITAYMETVQVAKTLANYSAVAVGVAHMMNYQAALNAAEKGSKHE